MELSELTAYAAEKYHIQEQRKWSDFPGFSVLADPETGKWHALLMRQWDTETGTEIQRCDIKCGRECLAERRVPYLGMPYRMKGRHWVGAALEKCTEPEVIFRLFDRAVAREKQQGYTIVLEERPQEQQTQQTSQTSGGTFSGTVYRDTALPIFRGRLRETPNAEASGIPAKIREMKRLYEFGDGSLEEKCRNFYRQGIFMKDYEDDMPWTDAFKRYFPTYHDLNDRQLRGYFTWRTRVRRGEYPQTSSSFAYIYLYELLCGIGTGSPQESMQKMEEFRQGFVERGKGDAAMRGNLQRWMFEYAVLHGLPAETAGKYADPALLRRDLALTALKEPLKHTDEEIFDALCVLHGEKIRRSPVITGGGERGKHLFAAVWRRLDHYYWEGKDIFHACFGPFRGYSWNPLANAVHWEESVPEEVDYKLNPCRIYYCRKGVWTENRFEGLYFDKAKLGGIVHETDRFFRKYLKTGHYLRPKQGAEWVLPYLEAVAEEERKAEDEAARPKITINLEGLDKIRRDSLLTRDALLVEEEQEDVLPPTEEMQSEELPAAEEQEVIAAAESAPCSEGIEGLDPVYLQILKALLSGQGAEERIRESRLMPSIVADTINEAFFDEIGDNVLECDGDRITVVEDYLQDIWSILGESV